MRILKPAFLIPAALVATAVGFAMSATASAEEARPTAISAVTSTTVVGSGQDNLYSVNANDLSGADDPGKVLYVQGCSTCHGLNGQGGEVGGGIVAPSLVNVGAAKVDFYLSTGRMPLSTPVVQAPRKEPKYNQEQIDQIVKYVSTFGNGPAIPEVNPEEGNLVEGYEVFANNCAACHNSQGSGGALGRNYYAPELANATPTEIAEAVRTGPGSMPVFGEHTISNEELNSLVKYVGTLKTQHNPGGLTAGSLGPVSEGFIAWALGLGALLLITRWIGTRV